MLPSKDDKMGYVCVVGGANIDLLCMPLSKIQLRDSNPGHIEVSCGGVGRNIAENLARLGTNVRLLTVLGTDGNAGMLRANAEKWGIDLTHALTVYGASSTYISLNDVDGDMFVGFSAMENIRLIDKNYLEKNLSVLNGADCVVADANLTDGLAYLCDNVTSPIFFDAVSCAKVARAKPDLRNITCLKLNHGEALTLSGVDVRDIASAKKCFRTLACTKALYVSCGSEGVYYVSADEAMFLPSFRASEVVNASGAGDSFVAGSVYGFVNGYDFKDCALLGAACGAITVASATTVSDKMTADNVLRIFGTAKK